MEKSSKFKENKKKLKPNKGNLKPEEEIFDLMSIIKEDNLEKFKPIVERKGLNFLTKKTYRTYRFVETEKTDQTVNIISNKIEYKSILELTKIFGAKKCRRFLKNHIIKANTPDRSIYGKFYT